MDTFSENWRKPIYWPIWALFRAPKGPKIWPTKDIFHTHTHTWKSHIKKILRECPKTSKIPIFTYFLKLKIHKKMNKNSTPTTFWVIVMTTSNGNIFRVTGHLCGEFIGHRWIPHTKASVADLWYLLIRYWINGWVNNREAGDLRRYRVHYDAIVIILLCIFKPNIRKIGQNLREPIRFEWNVDRRTTDGSASDKPRPLCQQRS